MSRSTEVQQKAISRESRRIRPRPDLVTQGFWDAAKDGVLAIQTCDNCDTFQHPPQPLCLSCGGLELHFAPVSGEAQLWSWTTTHHKVIPTLEAELPYVCLIVELVEQKGLWLVCDQIGRTVDTNQFHVGLPMRVVFDTEIGDLVLPQFMPADTETDAS